LGGDDTLVGGLGQDAFVGGGGSDFVSYQERKTPVNASLDGVANDGAAGEGENVPADVENLRGGSAGDHLAGDAGAHECDGGAGTDTFVSGGGNDTVSYASHATGVNVSLDGVANDGRPGDDE